MSIATAINDLSGRIQDAYEALSAKGATMPEKKDTWHLSATIDSIPAGGFEIYGIKSVDQIMGRGLINNTRDFTGVELFDATLSGFTTSQLFMAGLFQSNTALRTISFPELSSVTTDGMKYMCYNASNLSAAYFPKLTQIQTAGMNSAFRSSNIKSIAFPELTAIATQGMLQTFASTTNLTSVSFPKLSNIAANGLQSMCNLSQVKELHFPAITSISATNIFSNIKATVGLKLDFYFDSCTNITVSNAFNQWVSSLHFSASNQAALEATNYYWNRWGAGANTPVYFDL